MSSAPQFISSGHLSVYKSKGFCGWSKPLFFAFAEASIPLDRLGLAYRKGLKKGCRSNPCKATEGGSPAKMSEHEAANERHFKTLAVAAVSGAGILAAYKSDGEEDLKHPVLLIDLRDVVDVTLTPKKSKGGRFAMTIHTSGNPIRVAAASEVELEQWVGALQFRVRGVAYGDFEADAENRRVYELLVNAKDFQNAVADATVPAAEEAVATSAEGDAPDITVTVAETPAEATAVPAGAETPEPEAAAVDQPEEHTAVEEAASTEEVAAEDTVAAASVEPVVVEEAAAAEEAAVVEEAAVAEAAAVAEEEDLKHPVLLIDLRDVVDVTLTPKKSKGGRFAMTIHTSGNPIRVAAASEVELEQWVGALQFRVRGVAYGDFEADAENRRVYELLVNAKDFQNAVADATVPAAEEAVATSAEGDAPDITVTVAETPAEATAVPAGAETPEPEAAAVDQPEEHTAVEEAASTEEVAAEDTVAAASVEPVVVEEAAAAEEAAVVEEAAVAEAAAVAEEEAPAAASAAEDAAPAAESAAEEAVAETTVEEAEVIESQPKKERFSFFKKKRASKAADKPVPQDIDDLVMEAPPAAEAEQEQAVAPEAADAPAEEAAAQPEDETDKPADEEAAAPLEAAAEEAPAAEAAVESKPEWTAAGMLRQLRRNVLRKKPAAAPAADAAADAAAGTAEQPEDPEASQQEDVVPEVAADESAAGQEEPAAQSVEESPAGQEEAAAEEGQAAEATPVAEEQQQPEVTEQTPPSTTPSSSIIRQLSGLFKKKKTSKPADVAEEAIGEEVDAADGEANPAEPKEDNGDSQEEASQPEEDSAAAEAAETPAAAAQESADEEEATAGAASDAAEPAAEATEDVPTTVEAAKSADAKEAGSTTAKALGRLFKRKAASEAA